MTNIAVIEDDRALNDLYRDLIGDIPGVIVHQAYNSTEGRRLLSGGGIDLVVLDIELDPGTTKPRSGFDLLTEFGREMAIIIVTGMPEDNLHELSIQLKAFEFVRKPANAIDLLHKVRHALHFENSETLRASKVQQSWPMGLSMDPACPTTMLWKGNRVNLTMAELTIALLLAQRQGRTVTYAELGVALTSGNSSRVLNQHMSGARRAFREVDKTFDRIGTDPSKGYLWKADAK